MYVYEMIGGFYMNFLSMTAIFAAFIFANLGFAGLLYYFMSIGLNGKDAVTIDTPEEAADRREWLD